MTMPLVSVPPGLQTELFCLGEGALVFLPEVLKRAFPGRRPFLVADGNTWRVAGERAEALLVSAGMPPAGKHVFPGSPRLHPDYAYCEKLAAGFPADAVPVAVGSGVINDLVKCAASLKKLDYCCVPTACSVDGYTSAGAALAVNGMKTTVGCPAPKALCADTRILATAPADMFASGFADLLAKVPAGADWVIADALGIEPIRRDVWDLIQGNIRRWIADPHDMMAIFDGLAATGYSMQMYLDSRPASGMEHMCSHVWEMEGLQFNGEDVSHGFKVGIGSIASTLLMEYVAGHSFDELAPRMKPGLSPEERSAEIDELLKRGCYGDRYKAIGMKKFLHGDALAARRERIRQAWEPIRRGVRERLIPHDELIGIMRSAGCPVRPVQIGLDREQFLHGLRTAQVTRPRYTVMDLLYELGLYEDALKCLDVMLP